MKYRRYPLKRKSISLYKSVSKQATTVMLLGTLTILLQLGYIAFDIFSVTFEDRFCTIQLYRSCFNYILLEVVLVVGGAFLFDVVTKDVTRGTHF
jgi:hypothetical protein